MCVCVCVFLCEIYLCFTDIYPYFLLQNDTFR